MPGRADCGRILGEVRTPGGRGGRGGELDAGRPSPSAGAAAPDEPRRGPKGWFPPGRRQAGAGSRASVPARHPPPPPRPRPAPPPAAASSRRPPSSRLRLPRGAGAGARGGARAERRPLRTCRARAQASTGWSSTRPCGRCRSGCRGCAPWAPAPTARSGRGGGESGEVRAGLSARPLPSLCEVPAGGASPRLRPRAFHGSRQ